LGALIDAKIEIFSACNEKDNAITITITDGTSPYHIHIQGNGIDTDYITNETTKTFEDLAYGTYQITITDDLGAVYQETVVIGNSIEIGGEILVDHSVLNVNDPTAQLDAHLVMGGESQEGEFTYEWFHDGASMPETAQIIEVD